MELNYSSKSKKENLVEIFENIELLLKLSPPQIKYELVDKEKGVFKQSIPIKKIKKTFEFEVKHKKISENKFSLEMINGPLKKSIINIIFKEKNGETEINLIIKGQNKEVYCYSLQNNRKFDLNHLKALKAKEYVEKITV